MNSIQPIIQESERVLGEAIKHFGLRVPLESIVLTIQTCGRRKALGWFGTNRWKNGKDSIHEINLSAEHLKTHDMGEVLIHELAHAENNFRKIKDCNASQYHNRKFKSMAEALGLKVSKHGRFGYGITDLDEPAKAFLSNISFKREVFQMSRLGELKRDKQGTRLIKLECEGCGYVVRTTQKWIETGMPSCHCGEEFAEA